MQWTSLKQSPAHTPYTPTSKISFGLITLYTISQVAMLSTHLRANVLSRLCSIKNASSKLNSFLGELPLDNNPMHIVISFTLQIFKLQAHDSNGRPSNVFESILREEIASITLQVYSKVKTCFYLCQTIVSFSELTFPLPLIFSVTS